MTRSFWRGRSHPNTKVVESGPNLQELVSVSCKWQDFCQFGKTFSTGRATSPQACWGASPPPFGTPLPGLAVGARREARLPHSDGALPSLGSMAAAAPSSPGREELPAGPKQRGPLHREVTLHLRAPAGEARGSLPGREQRNCPGSGGLASNPTQVSSAGYPGWCRARSTERQGSLCDQGLWAGDRCWLVCRSSERHQRGCCGPQPIARLRAARTERRAASFAKAGSCQPIGHTCRRHPSTLGLGSC